LPFNKVQSTLLRIIEFGKLKTLLGIPLNDAKNKIILKDVECMMLSGVFIAIKHSYNKVVSNNVECLMR